MKQYTSAASLAVALSWKPVALAMGLTCLAQWLAFDPFFFQVWSFEDAMEGSGGILNPAFLGVLGFYAILCALGCACSKLPGDTLGRLRISQKTLWWVFAGIFTGYFLLYWAVQIGWTVLLFAKSQRWVGGNWDLLILAAYRSEYLHLIFPHGDVWGWCSRLVLTGMHGIGSAAVACNASRGGKFWIAIVLGMVVLERLLYSMESDIKLFVLLVTAGLSLLLGLLMWSERYLERRDPGEA